MCANTQRNRAYWKHVHTQVDAYVHEGEQAELAGDVREILDDHGQALPAWDGDGPATTAWKTDDSQRSRHRVEVTARAPGYVVRMTEQTQVKAPPTWNRHSRSRDQDLEAAVLERVYPGRGSKLGASEIATHTYDIAPAVLWTAVTDELSQHGAMVMRTDAPVDITVSSRWMIYEGDEPSRVRHDVQIVPVGSHQHRLEVHRVVEHGDGTVRWEAGSEQRDYELELALIRRRDATAAGTIETEAHTKADEAFDRAVDAGAIACGR